MGNIAKQQMTGIAVIDKVIFLCPFEQGISDIIKMSYLFSR
jgi:hypothetical protein